MIDKQLKFKEIIERFQNGPDLYMKNPLFQKIAHMILNGADEYTCIEELLKIIEGQQEQIKHSVKPPIYQINFNDIVKNSPAHEFTEEALKKHSK